MNPSGTLFSFFKRTSLLFLLTVLILPACTSDKDDPEPDCITTNVSYSATIVPIMATNCNSCHSGPSPNAGIVTSTHAGLVDAAITKGRLLGAINHETGFSPMPQNQSRLPQCPRSQIGAWVNDGAPNN
jgi:uncharacterized membrane protein